MKQSKKVISFIIFIAFISLGNVSYGVNLESLEIGDLVNFGEYHEKNHFVASNRYR